MAGDAELLGIGQVQCPVEAAPEGNTHYNTYYQQADGSTFCAYSHG